MSMFDENQAIFLQKVQNILRMAKCHIVNHVPLEILSLWAIGFNKQIHERFSHFQNNLPRNISC